MMPHCTLRSNQLNAALGGVDLNNLHLLSAAALARMNAAPFNVGAATVVAGPHDDMLPHGIAAIKFVITPETVDMVQVKASLV